MAMEPISIHPGVVGGRRRSPKVNTCANSSSNKRLERQLAGIQKHLENYPQDSLSQMRVAIAEGVVQILIEMKAPGCQWLALTEAA